MLLAYNLTDIGDIVLCRHEVGEVVHVQLVHTTRDQSVVIPFDGYDMIGVVRSAEFTQRTVQDLGPVPEFDT